MHYLWTQKIESVKAWGGWDPGVRGSVGERGTSARLSTILFFFNPVTLLSITFIKHQKLYLELDNAGKPLTKSLIKRSL